MARLDERLRDHSTLLALVSVLRQWLRSVGGRVNVATRRSTVRRSIHAMTVPLERAAANAWLTRAYARAERVVRASLLYRWLTKEPDPEVIVIDLRETWSVGPVIALVDWLVARLVPVAERSRVRQVVHAVGTRLRAAPVRVGGAVVLGMGVVWAVVGGVSIGVLVVLALGALALREDRSWAALAETRVAGWLRAALAPPEPPEESNRE